VNELDVLRREFEAVREPDEVTVDAARGELLREIAVEAKPACVRPRRRWIRPAFALGVAALVAAAVALVNPRSDGLTGAEIAAAAYRAVTPADGHIWHQVIRTTRTPLDGTASEPQVWERWVATSPPYAVRVSSPGWGEAEVSPCGSIQYTARDNVLRVLHDRLAPDDPRPYDAAISGATDPARRYRHLFRSGLVRYRGETTFRGIAAYLLVVGGRETSLTYFVRRDNYHPLGTVRRTQTFIEVTTFSKFEYLDRSAKTSRLLHVRSHPGARLVHTGRRPRGTCAGFGSTSR
jgi:hypothetical protein